MKIKQKKQTVIFLVSSILLLVFILFFTFWVNLNEENLTKNNSHNLSYDEYVESN